MRERENLTWLFEVLIEHCGKRHTAGEEGNPPIKGEEARMRGKGARGVEKEGPAAQMDASRGSSGPWGLPITLAKTTSRGAPSREPQNTMMGK